MQQAKQPNVEKVFQSFTQSYSLNSVRWENYADFPLSLLPSALASPESQCQAEGTEVNQGFHPDSTETQRERGEMETGNDRMFGKYTKKVVCSYKMKM